MYNQPKRSNVALIEKVLKPNMKGPGDGLKKLLILILGIPGSLRNESGIELN